MSASKEHDLIVAMVARYIRQRGYELVALEGAFVWLFGDSFRLPPSIILHRPDVVGVRDETPFICIGEAKTRNDIHTKRTKQQLKDFAETSIGEKKAECEVVLGIPQDCERALGRVLKSLDIAPGRIKIVTIPRALL